MTGTHSECSTYKRARLQASIQANPPSAHHLASMQGVISVLSRWFIQISGSDYLHCRVIGYEAVAHWKPQLCPLQGISMPGCTLKSEDNTAKLAVVQENDDQASTMQLLSVLLGFREPFSKYKASLLTANRTYFEDPEVRARKHKIDPI